MATFIIPTRTDSEHYEEQVELDGVVYGLKFAWNHRASGWFLSLAKQDGTPILSGLRIVADWPLLHYCSHPDKPGGNLMAMDTSGAGLDPGLTELGSRVLLMYQEAVV
jgi:hypothetical protein